jgi:DNA processing protein
MKLMTADLKYLNALNSIPNIGAVTLRCLKEHFGSYEAAWYASEAELKEVNGLGEVKLRSILWKRPSLNPDRELEKLVRNEIWAITEDDSAYPALLKEISHPPVILYGRGDPALLQDTRTDTNSNNDTNRHEQSNVLLAVVGTRKPTHYGLEAAEKITYALARAGITIVSGLAIGIDARAHEAVLDAGGKTIAVLGSGVNYDSIFPPENRGLARRIIEGGGTIISEYAPGTPAMRGHFPARNRIIAGLSRGLLVAEAREKSGARISARLALEANREVFAVPGSIFSFTSRYPNMLIQEGAKLVLQAEDILQELGVEYTNNIKERRWQDRLKEEDQKILSILEEPLSVDLIKERSGLDTPTVIASISMLELKGYIRNLGGDTYQKI